MDHTWKHLLLLTLFMGAAIFISISTTSVIPTDAFHSTMPQPVTPPVTVGSADESHTVPQVSQTAVPTATLQPTTEAVDDAGRVVTIKLVEGEVNVRHVGSSTLQAASVGQQINPGDELTTGPEGRALLQLDDGALMAVSENSVLALETLEGTAQSPITRFILRVGEIFAGRKGMLPGGGSFEILTPHSIAAIRGSAMRVSVTGPSDPVRMACVEGHCYAGLQDGTVDVVGGQTVNVRIGGYWDLRGLSRADFEAWEAAFALIEQAGLELDIEPPVLPSATRQMPHEAPNRVDSPSEGEQVNECPPVEPPPVSDAAAPGNSGNTAGSEFSSDAPGKWVDTPAGGNQPAGADKNK